MATAQIVGRQRRRLISDMIWKMVEELFGSVLNLPSQSVNLSVL
jgi:hypothetical protein